MLAEQGIHPFQRFRSPGQDYDTANGSVNAVYDTQEDGARFVILLSDVVFAQVDEGNVSGDITLNQNPRGLINDQEVVVFINYMKGRAHR
jgi:hypothetical protein